MMSTISVAMKMLLKLKKDTNDKNCRYKIIATIVIKWLLLVILIVTVKSWQLTTLMT